MVESDAPAPGRTLIISDGMLASLGPTPSFLGRGLIRLLAARTGSEVLTLAGASDPGLLLLDYAMPELRADRVCQKIRANPRLREIPVVIVGPPEPARIEIACRQSGCSLFTPAPANFGRLLPRIAEYLGIPARQEERIPVVLSVSYGTVVSEVLGRSVNLSVGGMLVNTTTPLRTGFFVSLRFLPDKEKKPILAPGRILRVTPTDEGEYEVAVRFLTLPLESSERIEKLLERQKRMQRQAL